MFTTMKNSGKGSTWGPRSGFMDNEVAMHM